MNTRDLYEAFATLGTAPFVGEVFRHVAPDFDCHSGDGASIRGGRWNPNNSFPTLYSALLPETSAHELRRFALRSWIHVDDLLPRKLCVLQVELGAVLDLQAESLLSVVGLRMSDVLNDDWGACRRVGEAACKFGIEGILVPSATRVGLVLVVFPLNLGVGSRLDTIRTDSWITEGDLPV